MTARRQYHHIPHDRWLPLSHVVFFQRLRLHITGCRVWLCGQSRAYLRASIASSEPHPAADRNWIGMTEVSGKET
jgi:hypothetical protein